MSNAIFKKCREGSNHAQRCVLNMTNKQARMASKHLKNDTEI